MRLTALDVFRGLAIAGMILVNNPGSWKHVYPPLLHAEWHGCTPTDLVFPTFLFIIGVAMAFSLAKYLEGPTRERSPAAKLYWRIGRRCGLLFALGLFLNGFSGLLVNGFYDFSTIRIMGVLQRIALAYLLAAIVIFWLPRSRQWVLAGTILLVYWLALSIGGDLSPTGNLGAAFDRLILGSAHLYAYPPFDSQGDPEGLFSTLPAVVTILLGYFTGQWLRHQQVRSRTSKHLMRLGLAGLAIGSLWGLLFPINKQLWTSSYVLFTAGWSLLLLALCYETIEVRGWRRWGWPFEVVGLNAIFVFVASGMLARILLKTYIGAGEDALNVYTWIYQQGFQSWAGSMNGSLAFAIATVLFWWIVLYGMYRQRWFLKL